MKTKQMSAVYLAMAGLLLAVGNVSAATQTVTNGILTVSISDAGGNIGQFTVTTGDSHPNPSQTVFYPIGTSNITLRDVGAAVMWSNDGSAPAAGLAGYTATTMNTQPAAVTPIGTNGFRTTYTLPNFTVVQDVVIDGTTLADTNVRHTISVTNNSAASRQYGVRNMWDWQIADNDASYFRQRSPDTAFTDVFSTFVAPAFTHYEMVDDLTTPAFSVFGTVHGGSLSPQPTPPDQLRYSSWSAAINSAWDFDNTGSAIDSAVFYYWGFDTPLTLAPGATGTHTQYVATVLGAVGGAASGSTSIPTLTEWGLMTMSLLLAGLGYRQLRRPKAGTVA